MAFEEIGLQAVLEGVSDFISDAEGINDSVSAMGSAFDAGASLIAGAGDLIGGAIGGLASAALDLAASAGGALIDFFGDSFSGALEAEQTIARLGQVIESTGGAAGVTVDEAQYLADEFAFLAQGSDDAVLSIIDMGLRMGTISEEEMPAFIQSTLDLGAVMGDAGKAAQLMARAQEDPVGVLGALRKAGILVNETTEEQIKAMVKSGDTAGAYALLMDRVGEATAGAAETMAETAAGQWQIFTETIADAGESIAMSFLPTLNTLMQNVLVPMLPIIQEVATAFSLFFETLLSGDVGGAFDVLGEFDTVRAIIQGLGIDVYALGGFFEDVYNFVVSNIPLVQSTFETVFTSIQSVLQVLSDFVTVTLMPAIATIWEQTGIQLPTAQQTFESVMSAIVMATQMVSDFITNTVVPALTAAVDWVVANWPSIQATIQTVWDAAQLALNAAVEFFNTTLVPAFQTVVDWVVTNWPTIQTNIETVFNAIQTVVNSVINAVVPFVVEKFTEIKAWVDTNWPLIQATIETVINAINSVITTVVTAITSFWDEHFTTIQTVAQTTWDNIKINIDTTIALIEGIIKTVMQLITGDWEGAWNTIQTTADTVWTNIQTQIDNTVNAISTVVQDVIGTLKTWWDTKWTEIKTSVSTIISDILTNITTKITEIQNAFTSVDWLKVGSDIIQGVANGIAGAVGGLVSAATNAALDAFNAAKAALGISSPSRAFEYIGQETMVGFSRGIEQTASLARNQATVAAQGVVTSTLGVLQRAQPQIQKAAAETSTALLGGFNMQQVCNEVAKQAEQIGSKCIPAGLAHGLGASTAAIGDIVKNGIIRPGGLMSGAGAGSITPSLGGMGRGGTGGISTSPTPTTGALPTTLSGRMVSNTYQYSPTYNGTPISPERDFALMQVLAGA